MRWTQRRTRPEPNRATRRYVTDGGRLYRFIDWAVKHEERVSRRHVAERPADVASALTAGGTLEPRAAGEELSVRVVDELLLKWHGKATGDHMLVELEASRIV